MVVGTPSTAYSQVAIPLMTMTGARVSYTLAERVNARLKDEFGARSVRVRGAIKVKCHLMFGVVALAVDQILRLPQLRPAPA